MNGLMQTSFFFGYNTIMCYAFFLKLRLVGLSASLMFVPHLQVVGGWMASWVGGIPAMSLMALP